MTHRKTLSNLMLGQAVASLLVASAFAQVTPPSVLNPTDPDLRLWLDAGTLAENGLLNGDPVTSWVDQSSYGTIMAPRTTTDINGPYIGDPVEENPHFELVEIAGNLVPSVRFDRDGPPSQLGDPNVDGTGSTDRLYQTNNLVSQGATLDPLDIGDGTSLTSFIVFKPNVTTSLNEQGGPILGAQVVFGKRGTGSSVYTMGIWNFPGPTLGLFNYVTYDGPTSYYSGTPPTDQTWHVTSMEITDIEGTSSDELQFYDSDAMDPNQTLTPLGVKLGDGTPVTNIQNRNASTPEPFGIGGHSQACCGEGETFAGNIAELIIFGKTLTEQEFNDVSSYLSQKYFTPGNPNVEGDYDGDGDVDGEDLGVWGSQFGETPVPAAPNADGDGDGDVDGRDILLWQRNLGTGVGGPASAIPEPATAMLAAFGLAAIARRGRRKAA
jgi:hypothetical protein